MKTQTSSPLKSLENNVIYPSYIKPLLDYFIAIVLLLAGIPLFILVALVLFIANKGKVFFRQERIGHGEKVFVAFKFRTMNDSRDAAGNLLPDELRLTPAGKFIRKTSIDELPQIINVLKRDMSFIGPRPLLPEYLPYYNPIQKRRHNVKPGITGLAQVNGRNLTTWEKRFEFDILYVENISLKLDFQILLKTFIKVIKSEGISAEGHPTMPKFSDYSKTKEL